MKIHKYTLLLILYSVISQISFGQTCTPTSIPYPNMGTNIADPNGLPWVNLWNQINSSHSTCCGSDSDKLTLGTDGWPVSGQQHKIIIGRDQLFIQPIVGTIKISYKGTTSQLMSFDATGAETLVTSSNNFPSAGYAYFEYTVNLPNAAVVGDEIFMRINGHIEDVKIMRPGYNLDENQVFVTEYNNVLSQFTTLRFMGFLRSNNHFVGPDPNPYDSEYNIPFPPYNGNYDREINWADRALVNTPQTMNGNKGGSWEYVVKICNDLNKNAWINIPIMASDEYVTELAKYLKNNLKPGLIVYYEFGNEIWNSAGDFACFRQAYRHLLTEGYNSAAIEANSWQIYREYPARRTKAYTDLFAAVWGWSEINNRIRPVLAGQIAYNYDGWQIKAGLDYIERVHGEPAVGRYFYAVSPAPYFSPHGNFNSVNQIINDCQTDIDNHIFGEFSNEFHTPSSSYLGNKLESWLAHGGQYGLKMMCYEGGPDMEYNLVTAQNGPGNLKDQAMRDNRMTGLCLDYWNTWYARYGYNAMFNQFTSGFNSSGLYTLGENLAVTSTRQVAINQILSNPAPVIGSDGYRQTIPGIVDARKTSAYASNWNVPTALQYQRSADEGCQFDCYNRWTIGANKNGVYKIQFEHNFYKNNSSMDIIIDGKTIVGNYMVPNASNQCGGQSPNPFPEEYPSTTTWKWNDAPHTRCPAGTLSTLSSGFVVTCNISVGVHVVKFKYNNNINGDIRNISFTLLNETPPFRPNNVIGDISACSNQSDAKYEVDVDASVCTYKWVGLPGTASVLPDAGGPPSGLPRSGALTNILYINWGSTPNGTYPLTVFGINDVGTSPGRVFNVLVTTCGFTFNPSPSCVNSVVGITPVVPGAVRYTWNFGANSSPSSLVTTSPSAINVSYSLAGSKTVSLVVSLSGGNTRTFIQGLTIATPPTIGAVSPATQSGCAGSNVVLSATGTGAVWRWLFSTNGGSSYAIYPGATLGIFTFPGLSTTTLFRAVVENLGCPALTSSGSALASISSASVSFIYGASSYCSGPGFATPTGTFSGGSFSRTSGPGTLLLNTFTGVVSLTGATAGVHTIRYFVPVAGACPSLAGTNTITIAGAGSAGFTAANILSRCQGAGTNTFIATTSGGTMNYLLSAGSAGTINISTGLLTWNNAFVGVTTIIGSVTGSSCGSLTANWVVTVTSLPIVSISGINNICNGSFASLTATGATTYLWQPGSLSGSIQSLSPSSTTTYTVIGTNAGCTDTEFFTITVNSVPAISGVTRNHVSNCGLTDGSFTLTGTGGVLPYQFSRDNFSTVSTTGIFSALGNGTYTGFIRNSTSPTCTNTFTGIVVTTPSAPTSVTTNIQHISSCAAADGAVTLTGVGGSSALQYSIDGTTWQTSGVFTFSGATTNIIPRARVSASPNCSVSGTIFNITAPGTPTFGTVSISHITNCGQTNGAITITGSGGTPPLEYGIVGGSTNLTGIFTSLGTFSGATVFVRNLGSPACSVTGTFTLTTPSAPSSLVQTTASITDCGGSGGLTLTGIAGSGAMEYSRDGGATYSTTGIFAFTSSITGIPRIRTVGFSACTVAGISYIITTPSAPTSVTTNIQHISSCAAADGAVTLTGVGGSGALQYSINGSTWQTSGVFTFAGASSSITPRARVSASPNCSVSGTLFNITAPGTPTFGAVSVSHITNCGQTNGAVTITGSGGTPPLEYRIVGGSTNLTGIFTSLGTFSGATVFVRNQGSPACSVTGTFTLTTPSAPSSLVQTTASITDCGGSGGLTLTGIAGSGAMEYSKDGGATYSTTGIFAFTSSFTGIPRIRTAGFSACTVAGISYTITTPSAPTNVTTSIKHISSCAAADGAVTLTGVGGSSALQYSIDGSTWQTSGVFTFSGASSSITPRARVSASPNCSVAGTLFNITAPGTPTFGTVSISHITNCGQTNGAITITGSGGTPPLEYGIIGGPAANATGIFTSLGTYTGAIVFVRNQGSPACSVTGTFTLTTPSAPIFTSATPTNPSNCSTNDGAIAITATAGSSALQYSINGGGAWLATNNNTSQSAGIYSIAIRNTGGTCSVLGTTLTLSGPSLTPTISYGASSYCNNATITTTSGTNLAGGLFRTTATGITLTSGNGNIAAGATEGVYVITYTIAGSGFCTGVLSTPATVTIVGPATAGNVSGPNTSILLGASTGTMTLSGQNGSIVAWQLNTGTGWNNIAATAGQTSYSQTPNALGNWQYRVVVSNGICSDVTTTGFTVQVNGLSGAVQGSQTTVCANTPLGVLSLTGFAGSVLKWVYSINGGTNIDIANTTSLLSGFGNLTATGTYSFAASISGSGLSTSKVITVEAAPVAGNITPSNSTICGGINYTLSITGQVGTIERWKRSTDGELTWTNIVNTGTSNTESASQNTSYVVEISNGVCVVATTTSINVAINQPSVGGTVTGGSSPISLGSAIGTLSTSGSTGSVIAYQKSYNGGLFTMAINNETPSAVGVYEYRAIVQSGVCSTTTSTINQFITVTGSTGSLTTVPSPVVLNGAFTPISIVGLNGSVSNWEYSSDNGANWTVIANTTSNLTSIPTGTYNVENTWQIRASITGIGYTNIRNIEVHGLPTITNISKTNVSNCNLTDGTITINATGNHGLQYSLNGTTWTTTGVFTGLSNTTYYIFVRNANSTFITVSGASQTITTPSAPNIGSTALQHISGCGLTDGAITINATGGTGALQYSADNFVTVSTTSTIGNLSANSYTVYVRNATSQNCVNSLVGQVLTAPGTPVSGSIIGAGQNTCSGFSTTLTLNGSTGTVQWQSSLNSVTGFGNVGPNSSILGTGALSSSRFFRAIVINGLCAPATTAGVSIFINPILIPSVSIGPTQNTICFGTSVTFTTLGVNGGNNPSYQWKLNGNNVGTSAASYSNSTLSNGDAIRVELTSSEQCVSAATATSAGVVMNVQTPPSNVSVLPANQNICLGIGTAIISVSGIQAGTNYQLLIENVPVGNTQSGTAGSTLNFAPTLNTSANNIQIIATTNVCTSAKMVGSVFGINVFATPSTPTIGANYLPVSGGYCTTNNNPIFTSTGIGGTFIGINMNKISESMSILDLSKFTTSETNTSVVYRIDNGVCPLVSSNTLNFKVNAAGSVPNFSYSMQPQCKKGELNPLNAISGSFTSSSKISINQNTGVIDLGNSAVGQYTVNLTTTGNGSCLGELKAATVTIVSASVGKIVSMDEACEGSNISLQLDKYTGDKVTWQEEENGIWNTISTQATYVTSPLAKGTYKYQAVVSKGTCDPATVSKTFTVNELTKPGILTANKPLLCDEFIARLTLKQNVGNIKQWQYATDTTKWQIWNASTADTSVNTEQFNDYGQVGFYRAMVENGKCGEKFTSAIKIETCNKTNFIPNALTPNSGDLNSTWDLTEVKLRDSDMVSIYNRYGVKLIEKTGLESRINPWDGSELPAGTYYYVIKSSGNKDKVGGITVIK